MRFVKYLIPLLVFAVIGWFSFKALDRDPRELPSPLIGKPAPAFSLPTLADPTQAWTPQAMAGKVWLLNVWGSWCTTCQIEHPMLLQLQREGSVPLVGLAWKDMPANSQAWLKRFGDPYTVTISDFSGKVGVDYGVYGAPETYLIDKAGVIRFKHVGALNAAIVDGKLLPLVRQLQGQS